MQRCRRTLCYMRYIKWRHCSTLPLQINLQVKFIGSSLSTQHRSNWHLLCITWWVVVLSLFIWDQKSRLPVSTKLVIDDVWWNNITRRMIQVAVMKRTPPPLFLRPCFHSLLTGTWMNWTKMSQLQGKEINFIPSIPTMSGYYLKGNCFTLPSWLQDMC